ncbi:T9SS type A sorting domain-containing protein [Carboxylicivirga marina]|uniref:T9SS type A sorting domain-containing protein n=1 Tax=Carboxylicivirga marina TaxID=2800988 RepID=A0ABS1HNM2_9BACT|nr:T9SS type A sorting domain-containing protein [Carboxylicivirga marina]MBK3519241.1 T9SS type A sorting domain-containing protein [Carboxylicivirga marina]
MDLPVIEGFESDEGYASDFSVSAQNSWANTNPTSIWKDVFSSADASDKLYVSSIEQQIRPGSAGEQCMKFEINHAAYNIKEGTSGSSLVKLRTLALDNLIQNNDYIIRVWAKTTTSNGVAAISATNGNYQTITNEWVEYELPFTGVGSQIAQVFFKDIDADYDVLLDDMSIEDDPGTVTSITDAFDSKVMIYPNPLQSTLNIKTSGQVSSVEIYSLTGQKVYGSNLGSKQIDVAQLEKGVYIVSMVVDGEVIRKKVTKQ